MARVGVNDIHVGALLRGSDLYRKQTHLLVEAVVPFEEILNQILAILVVSPAEVRVLRAGTRRSLDF